MSAAKAEIRYAVADGCGSLRLLDGEIIGACSSIHNLKEGESVTATTSNRAARIFVVCRGQVEINGIPCNGRGVYAFVDSNIFITSISDSTVLEIQKLLNMDEKPHTDRLPYFIRYGDAVRYKEDCKSEKTVSRMLLEEGLIPGVALGSVETYGKDSIGIHSHPFCDQLFFSFEENDMDVLIDGAKVHMGGNTLLHIPLGSSHGVDIPDRGCAHYVWIDFIIDERGIEYMSSAHQKI